jgi:UDP-N-acetylglucosamine--N-acetylmuramyl-(pentapeptide) pyrophosphoryl-undecaprenol N-acetylglucosamine transferase
MRTFLMAGGGTGGHVIPLLAVASELRRRGHDPRFIGTRRGMEAKLVPAEGFPIDWIEIGGLMSVGLLRTLKTLLQLPVETLRMSRWISAHRPAAVFSMGGYVAGPVVQAAWIRRVPMILMEPNAVPGFTNRRIGRFAARALVSFEEAKKYFPKGRSETTGLPVRKEFFEIAPKPASESFSLLITGGSRGSRTLNNASRDSWKLFRAANMKIRIVHQAGNDDCEEMRREFAAAGLEGEVVPFIAGMPEAFAQADLIVCRSGAGSVSELAAAGKPAILVPFPFAADNHQLKNAEALARAGAAVIVEDKELTGQRLFDEVNRLASKPEILGKIRAALRPFAKPGAAERAADLLEDLAGVRRGDAENAEEARKGSLL